MIRVDLAAEPPGFDGAVRQAGLRTLAELVGEPAPTRPGRRRKVIARTRDAIPADQFPPYWREALPDLLASYNRICAYLGLYIYRATGAPTVDHMVPKSRAWDRVYEWDNYRLACLLMNNHKGAVAEVLDPFEVEDAWFELEFVGFQVKPGLATVGTPIHADVVATIQELGLNDMECCDARQEYVEAYQDGEIRENWLAEHAPFVAREMQRQGLLRSNNG